MHIIKRFMSDRSGPTASVLREYTGYLTNYVNLIASASYPFPEVTEVLSFPAASLPVEGFKGRRFFPGSDVFDFIDDEGERMALSLFGLDRADYGASLQPHSGTQANQAVFNAALKPNSLVLSLRPTDGGHISHTVLVGRRNEVIHFGVGKDGLLDYDEFANKARQHKPDLIVVGASSYPRQIDFARIGTVAKELGALVHADVSHTALFVATGVHQAVTPYADFITFNMAKNLRGPNNGVLIFKEKLRKQVENAIFPGTQGGPSEVGLLARLAAFEVLERIDARRYAEKIQYNGRVLAKAFMERGLKVVTNGTDCHIVLVDLEPFGLTGADLEFRLEKLGVLANRNQVPGDKRAAWEASGLRFGVTCATILEWPETVFQNIADLVADCAHGNQPHTTPSWLEDQIRSQHAWLVSPDRTKHEENWLRAIRDGSERTSNFDAG